MRVKAYKVHVFRYGSWIQVDSDQLVPGDITLVLPEKSHEGKDKRVIPCDMLVLHGSGIVDESILTGESVPQVRECVSSRDADETLDSKLIHKSHVLYGGTELV